MNHRGDDHGNKIVVHFHVPKNAVTHVSVDRSVNRICCYTFCHCTSLTPVELLDGLESIGESVFKGCIDDDDDDDLSL